MVSSWAKNCEEARLMAELGHSLAGLGVFLALMQNNAAGAPLFAANAFISHPVALHIRSVAPNALMQATLFQARVDRNAFIAPWVACMYTSSVTLSSVYNNNRPHPLLGRAFF